MPADTPPANQPVTDLTDPRAITLLTTEHWSLLSARALAYNEAFARGGMFLSFLSMSFVALALLSQGMTFGTQFLTVAAIVLAFDLVIGLATYGRIMGANIDDLRTVHGMARLRHGYVEIAPIVHRYFTAPTHDDIESLVSVYGAPAPTTAATFFYGITTSGGMIALITAMVAGVFAAVVALLAGASGSAAVWVGVVGTLAAFALIYTVTYGLVPRAQRRLGSIFPSAGPERDSGAAS